ncbi:uncharacterized protein [Nerophis lumbriciformis]|uniref:uncharacterized protein isoform X2 n=1 Tax=Nerophis lumbriciformis TaxID=546530 RepID=UPI002AE05D80|nr:ABC transporter F family member 4-like isoform X2 [Nerophis lumbriciformis]
MSSEEDSTLLFLVFQHLKTKGLFGAAELLEKHVVKVETAQASVNLQDIYRAWMKLCFISHHAEQLAEDKSIKIKPQGSTDETLSEEYNMDTKASLASEQTMEANGNAHDDSPDDDKEEEEGDEDNKPRVIMVVKKVKGETPEPEDTHAISLLQPQDIADSSEVKGETPEPEEADVTQTEATPTSDDSTELMKVKAAELKPEENKQIVLQATATCAQDTNDQPTQTPSPAGEQQDLEEPSAKKKGKKRKKHDEEKSSDGEVKKKKVEDLQEEKVDDLQEEKVDDGVCPLEEEKEETKVKKRKRGKKKTGERSQEVQCDAGPAGGDTETPNKEETEGEQQDLEEPSEKKKGKKRKKHDKEKSSEGKVKRKKVEDGKEEKVDDGVRPLEEEKEETKGKKKKRRKKMTGGAATQCSSSKKTRWRKKPSLKKRMRMSMKRKKLQLGQNKKDVTKDMPQPSKASKSEEEAPKSKKKSIIDVNGKKDKKKKRAANEEEKEDDVGNLHCLPVGHLSPLSEKKKKKKKKKAAEYVDTPVHTKTSAKKIKKKLKYQKEDN